MGVIITLVVAIVPNVIREGLITESKREVVIVCLRYEDERQRGSPNSPNKCTLPTAAIVYPTIKGVRCGASGLREDNFISQ